MTERTATTATVSPGTIELPVELAVPADATRLVVFSHAWGVGLESDNDRKVAANLNDRGVATLRFDMLSDAERQLDENGVDWPLLTARVLAVTDWAADRYPDLDVGYLGTSAGAAPALRAAARREYVDGVVTRGGRVDLAPRALDASTHPLLMVVGSRDEPFRSINFRADQRLGDRSDVHVLDGASHSDLTDDHLATLAEQTAAFFDAL